MRSVVDRAQRRRVVVVSLVLLVCAQSEPSLPGAKMAEVAAARTKTRAHTTVSDGEDGGAGGDKRKIGRSEVWHAVLLRRTRTRRRRHASYPPASSSTLASPLPVGPCLPPVSRPRSFFFLHKLSLASTASYSLHNILLLFYTRHIPSAPRTICCTASVGTHHRARRARSQQVCPRHLFTPPAPSER